MPRKGTHIPKGAEVQRLRVEHGWTQEELAGETGLSKRTIERIESGQPTTISNLGVVADALGVKVVQIRVETGNGEAKQEPAVLVPPVPERPIPTAARPAGPLPSMLRVFVSSTWLDLQPERQAVEQALARLRETKFIGMEYFGSRDETTWEVSLLEVGPTDLYVGIIGGRYGSGITEQEYRRARELNLPCFIYFKDEATIGPTDRDAEPEKAERLAQLKEEMRRDHIIGPPFRNPDDLAAKLTADLHRWVFDSYLGGVAARRTDYGGRIQNFLEEYLGTLKEPVPFGGRDAELTRLDAWLDAPHGQPYALLTAPAGRGKSALLVRWTQRLLSRSDLGLAFVPVSIRFRTNLASVVFPAVMARLAALHGEPLPAPDPPAEVWRGMVTDYLTRPLPNGRRLLLVLDGVDKAADWQPGSDLFPGSPPEGLRVLVSARLRGGDSGAGSWLASLGWDRPGLGQALDLGPLTQSGIADVLIRMGRPLDELGRQVAIVAELYRLSEGDPVLVRLYVDDLWKRGEAAARLHPDDLKAIQPGLKGFLQKWWDEQYLLWGAQTPLREPAVQELLNLLSCATNPLKRKDVLRLASPELRLRAYGRNEG
jgi:transcriptional regulator with XRE-family HTH domain